MEVVNFWEAYLLAIKNDWLFGRTCWDKDDFIGDGSFIEFDIDELKRKDWTVIECINEWEEIG